MKAMVTSVNHQGVEMIEVNGHKIQFGGEGDGFCYAHQSFDCAENLTKEEQDATDNAEYVEGCHE